jgi:hypothetical protein
MNFEEAKEWQMQLVKDIAVLNAAASSLLPRAVTELLNAAASPWKSRNKEIKIC